MKRDSLPSGVAATVAFGLLAALLSAVASFLLPGYYLYLAITAIAISIALLGLGVVSNVAGMIVLCQMSSAAVGAWVVTWLNQVDAPGGYLAWTTCGVIVAAVVATAIGAPALRLRGVNLAVVTLGFAVAIDTTIVKFQFPGTLTGLSVARPEFISSDQNFFLFCAASFILCAIAVHYLLQSRLGSGWRSVAFSERATAGTAHSVATLKLTAFAASGALAGLSGALMVGQVGAAFPGSFGAVQSLALYLLCLMLASQYFEAALFGGIMWVFVPELFKVMGIPQDWGLILFALMGIQALTTGTTIGDTIRRKATLRAGVPASGRTVALPASPMTAQQASPKDSPVLEVSGLGVRFDAFEALKDVDLKLEHGIITGLIGPNGAGKSTLIDAITGYIRPHGGFINLDGANLDGLVPHQRAQLGLRRTFQQGRVPPNLTVGEYIQLVSHGQTVRSDVADILHFFGIPGPQTPIFMIDIGTRRLVEVVAQICSRPKVLLLDEPAAGFSSQAREKFRKDLSSVPRTFGVSVLLIEHDLALVRDICDEVVVLNFGCVISRGTPRHVLSDKTVLEAYMGEVVA